MSTMGMELTPGGIVFAIFIVVAPAVCVGVCCYFVGKSQGRQAQEQVFQPQGYQLPPGIPGQGYTPHPSQQQFQPPSQYPQPPPQYTPSRAPIGSSPPRAPIGSNPALASSTSAGPPHMGQ